MALLPRYHSRNPSSGSLSIVPFLLKWRGLSLLVVCAVSLYALVWIWNWKYWLLNFTTYSLRPLYDTPEIPLNVVTHLHSPLVPQDDAAACRRHGWDLWRGPADGEKSKVVDAIIFSVEIDMLELRLAELSPIVSRVLVLESTSTFTGLPKPLVLGPLLQPNSTDKRFHPYLNKIRYRSMQGRQLRPGEHPFDIEIENRRAMTEFIHSPEVGMREGDLIIMSDVVSGLWPSLRVLNTRILMRNNGSPLQDEVPSQSAITLLSACAAPPPIHLSLSNHVYTFSQTLSPLLPSWRAHVTRYQRKHTSYSHGLSTPAASTPMLSDAGWHCSFCFPTIGDFVFKARGFSHTDRLGPAHSAARLLDPSAIKRVVCEGRDFFGMLPEAFEWSALFARWTAAGEREGGALPSELVRGGKEKWAWLIGEGGKEVRCRERKWERGDEWKFGAPTR